MLEIAKMFRDWLDNMEDFIWYASNESFSDDLIMKIEALGQLGEQNNEEKVKLTVLKAYALLSKTFNVGYGSKRQEVYEQILILLKNYADKPVGFDAYISTLISYSYFLSREHKCAEAVEIAEKAERVLECYRKQYGERPMHLLDICGGRAKESIKRDLEATYIEFGFCFWEALEKSTDIAKQAKYVCRAIHWQFIFAYVPQNDAEKIFKYYPIMLLKLPKMIETMLILRRFKQLDHILAISMYHLVKARRSLPIDQRNELELVQGRVCVLFARWGCQIILSSINYIRQRPVQAIDNVTFEEITGLVEPGVKDYEHQFPVEPMTSKDDIKAAFKHVKSWKKRAFQMLRMYDSEETSLTILRNFYCQLEILVSAM